MTFELNEQMVAVIGKALGAQPYELVAPVIAELQKQINAQQKPPPDEWKRGADADFERIKDAA